MAWVVMANETGSIVQRVWNFCTVLRDDGISYGDYVEQITYLLFLKMADEQTKYPFNKSPYIPNGLDWQSLTTACGLDLVAQYQFILSELGKKKGLLGAIFRKAQNRIQDPAKLKRLIELIDQEKWMFIDIDVKGEIYEGLLQKNAEDIKSGAGQYFTPRPLIKAIVDVVRPKPGLRIHDPACGTGGFFIASYDFINDPHNYSLSPSQQEFLKFDTFSGNEIVDNALRLCIMNLYLHGIDGADDRPCPIQAIDSLEDSPSSHYDIVMTNPPFGRKSSMTSSNGDGKLGKTLSYQRLDFWVATSNKQLNFLQHVKTLLEPDGKAAIVVPDNVLFEGGAGEIVRRKLLDECDVHTLLRLPSGIFYAQGVKANVLFFDNKNTSQPRTEKLWIYDLRTNNHFTLRTKQLTYEDLQDFIKCYNPKNRSDRTETERFKVYSYKDLIKREKVNLDIFWLKDESLGETDKVASLQTIAVEIAENLQSALDQFSRILEDVEESEGTYE
jgi:type I restriction enzyme M protein